MSYNSEYVHSFTVCGIYQVTHLLGEGSTGDVWQAFNILTGLRVAIKTHLIPVDPDLPAVLPYEAKVLELLRDSEPGIPKIHWSGVDGNHHVVVMDLLSPNLSSLRRVCRGSFSLRTICMLAEQMIARVQFIHSRGIVSGDIKPQNFAMGSYSNARTVYLFDFSNAELFINPSTGAHIPFRVGRLTPAGTTRYASVAAHKAHEVSRRDDIESLLYTLLELYHGQLPWEELCNRRDPRFYDQVAGMKEGPEFRDFLSESLPEFRSFHAHCTGLSYGQAPDYAFLRGLFRERMQREGWYYDWVFDWEDGASEKGTLVPDDYVFDLKFVERRALYPT
ncbi:kinase-like protein [Cerioporus squamosus]|nr:kinase-like protein [Cerioporus squamosus]